MTDGGEKVRRRKCVFPLATFVCWLAAAGVMAYDGGVDGLYGGLHVNATLTDSPCSLSAESADQTVDMGHLPQWRFADVGALSKPVSVRLILERCLFAGKTLATEHGDSLYWLNDQPVVLMNISGVQEPSNPHLYRVYGQAKGVALRLEDSRHNIIIPGERSRPQVLSPGRNELVINAQLSRTIQPLELGDFQSVIHVGLEYF